MGKTAWMAVALVTVGGCKLHVTDVWCDYGEAQASLDEVHPLLKRPARELVEAVEGGHVDTIVLESGEETQVSWTAFQTGDEAVWLDPLPPEPVPDNARRGFTPLVNFTCFHSAEVEMALQLSEPVTGIAVQVQGVVRASVSEDAAIDPDALEPVEGVTYWGTAPIETLATDVDWQSEVYEEGKEIEDIDVRVSIGVRNGQTTFLTVYVFHTYRKKPNVGGAGWVRIIDWEAPVPLPEVPQGADTADTAASSSS